MDKSKSAHQLWLNQAHDDLAWTQANLKEKVWYGAYFTAQQAAEKALKSYLLKCEENPKKIHDLGALLEECSTIDKSFEQLRQECITLTDYYAPARYPDIGEFMDFTEEKAHEAYKFAEKIVRFVDQKLKSST